MKIGISTACFYPEVTENAVQHLVDSDVQNIELFLNTFSEMEIGYIRKLKQGLNGTNVCSVHPFTSGLEPFLFFTTYNRRLDDGLELYKRYFQACAELGAAYFVFHGDRKDSLLQSNLYFERFGMLNRCAKSFGVEVLQENVSRCRSNDPAFIVQMKKYLGSEVGFVLDTKQCLRSGATAFDMLKTMGDSVKHVHISDSTAKFDCLPPGKGTFDFSIFFEQLKHYGFDGHMMIELYRTNYTTKTELIESYNHICNI